ncbi:MAG: pyrroline-5-carboxylate reductase, partial [Actinomycetota bacterium]
MGAALVGGLLSAGVVDSSGVVIVEVVPERRRQLAADFPGVTITESIPPCTEALIAVKPPDVAAACSAAVAAGARRVLSIADAPSPTSAGVLGMARTTATPDPHALSRRAI